VALSILGVLGFPAAPDATPIRIELDAPPDCATAEGFFEAVRARTERARPVKESEAGVRVVVRLTRVGTKVHGELRVIGERGESDTRRVDGASCTEVVEALSLTVALAVDPTARLGPTEQKLEPAPAPVCAPPEPPPEPAEPPPPRRELEVRLGAHAVVMGQVSPYVSFGGDLSLRVVAPWRSASSLGLAILYVRNDVFGSAEDASIGSTLFQLTACPERFGERDAFTFEPCLLGMGGWLNATGRGVDTSTSVTRSYFAAGAVIIGNASLSNEWRVEFETGFAVPLVKRRFTVSEPPREVGETPSISAIAGAGLTYSF
jgi:hypothetical protein